MLIFKIKTNNKLSKYTNKPSYPSLFQQLSACCQLCFASYLPYLPLLQDYLKTSWKSVICSANTSTCLLGLFKKHNCSPVWAGHSLDSQGDITAFPFAGLWLHRLKGAPPSALEMLSRQNSSSFLPPDTRSEARCLLPPLLCQLIWRGKPLPSFFSPFFLWYNQTSKE